MRILLAEDDLIIADGLCRALKKAGYAVDHVPNGAEADAALLGQSFDLLILDLGLPKLSGIEVLRRLRARKCAMPVLILTAQDGIEDRVRGLDAGADDYLTKPFAAVELLARVGALARRSRGQSGLRREFGPLSIDDEAHRAWLHGQPLDLPQREWAILGFFLDNPERVLSKERIVAAVCRWDQDMSVNAVEVYVSRLRTKLEPAGIRIRTIRGLGYMLEEDRKSVV